MIGDYEGKKMDANESHGKYGEMGMSNVYKVENGLNIVHWSCSFEV